MDAYLAIVSKRDERSYAERAVPEDVAARILDAGRLTGSARNLQPWRFVVVESREVRERLAEAVYVPSNILGAGLVVAVVCDSALDGGRAMQNMMLAAWNEGVVSCPNGLTDPDHATQIVGGRPLIVISFGYPARPRDPESRPAEEWSRRANRKPLEEVVERV